MSLSHTLLKKEKEKKQNKVSLSLTIPLKKIPKKNIQKIFFLSPLSYFILSFSSHSLSLSLHSPQAKENKTKQNLTHLSLSFDLSPPSKPNPTILAKKWKNQNQSPTTHFARSLSLSPALPPSLPPSERSKTTKKRAPLPHSPLFFPNASPLSLSLSLSLLPCLPLSLDPIITRHLLKTEENITLVFLWESLSTSRWKWVFLLIKTLIQIKIISAT